VVEELWGHHAAQEKGEARVGDVDTVPESQVLEMAQLLQNGANRAVGQRGAGEVQATEGGAPTDEEPHLAVVNKAKRGEIEVCEEMAAS
jgi:hypothetical protein